jgi:hypothetical protein
MMYLLLRILHNSSIRWALDAAMAKSSTLMEIYIRSPLGNKSVVSGPGVEAGLEAGFELSVAARIVPAILVEVDDREKFVRGVGHSVRRVLYQLGNGSQTQQPSGKADEQCSHRLFELEVFISCPA